MLRLKAKEFCDDPAFKASVGWYINWKRRHSITLRTKTTLAQRLPNDLEEQTVKFHRFVIATRQRHGYLLSRIFNMDETPMWFEMPSSRTLEFSGSRTVPGADTGGVDRVDIHPPFFSKKKIRNVTLFEIENKERKKN